MSCEHHIFSERENVTCKHLELYGVQPVMTEITTLLIKYHLKLCCI